MRLSALVSVALLATLVYSCGPSAPAAPGAPPAEPEGAPAVAVVDFVSGTAQAEVGGAWQELDMGDQVAPGTTVRTGKASVLELKAGDLATLRLGSDTVVRWEALVLDVERRRSQVQLLAGQLLNKVSKLVGNDSYLVRTKTAALGVRGTQFLVRVGESSSVLAVREGSVALLPPSFDPSAWQAGEPAERLEQGLLAASEVVSDNQRTELTADTWAQRSPALDQLGQPLPDNPETLLQAYRAAPPPRAAIEPLRPADREDLQPLDAMPLGEVALAPQAPPTGPPATPQPPSPPPSPSPPPPVTRVLNVTPGQGVASAVGWAGGFAVSDGQGSLRAFTPAGRALWAVSVPAVSNEAVAPVANGAELLWTGDASVVVLNAATGAITRTTALDTTTSGVFGKRAAVLGPSWYLGASDGIAVFDRSSGTRTATLAFAEGTDMSPTVFEGRVYVVGRAGTLYGFDPTLAAPVLTIATGASQPVATAPVVDAKRVWFADRKGQVVAVDRASSKVVWTVSVGASVFDQPVTDGRGLFVFAKGTLSALSLENGAALFPARPASVAALVAGDRLWTADGNQLLALDPTTGATIWSAEAPAAVSAVPFLVAGEVAFGFENGAVMLVDPVRAK